MTANSPFKTMDDVRHANKDSGFNWFSEDTMKWWKSKVESTLEHGRYFIISENEFASDGRVAARIYAVRHANDDGSIKTIKSHLKCIEDATKLIDELV